MGAVTRRLFSAERLAKRRAAHESARLKAGDPHVIEYFHQVDDPYSHLAVEALDRLTARQDVQVRAWLVGPPPDWAAPERDLLEAYARHDAQRLADRAGLDFTDPGRQPLPDAVARAQGVLAAALSKPDFATTSRDVGHALWTGEAIEAPDVAHAPDHAPDPGEALAAGDARRETLGHYLGATFFYGGEWYWGLDRLAYLETRLDALGATAPGGDHAPVYVQPDTPLLGTGADPDLAAGGDLHFFLSFRSPYTCIAFDRVVALAEAASARLVIRPVLPMVMRALPVPRAKRNYIAFDTAREARRLGAPFGVIVDPLGKPVERGYSLIGWAEDEGRGVEYCRSFLHGVWAHGLDAGSDAGLKTIVTRAGLDWARARRLLAERDADGWRARVEANRTEMIGLGLWGVPSLRWDDPDGREVSAWGQDRLWVIQDAMRAAVASQRGPT